MVAPNNAWDRLYRAMRQVDANNEDGAWTLAISGGGAGGTSSTDNTAFTVGATSVTPAAGYVGGRSVASGRTAVLAMNGSGVLQVDVISGGAGGGGGFASVAVYGSPANPVYVSGTVNIVGGGSGFATAAVYGSPAFPVYAIASVNVVNAVGVFGSMGVVGSVGVTQLGAPWSVIGSMGVTQLASATVNLGSIPTVNLGLGTVNVGNFPATSAFATVAVYGSPAFPAYIVGSVNVQGSLGVGQISAPWSFVGSVGVTPLATFTANVIGSLGVGNLGGSVGALGIGGSMGVTQIGAPWSIVGSVGITPLASQTVNMGSVPTVWYGGIGADTTNSAIRVNVVAGGAGGGIANLTVTGTGNTAYHAGYASQNLGAWPNYDGAAWLPVMFPSGFYPSLNVGNIVSVVGSAGVNNLGGSVGVTQIGAPWSVVGSVGVTPLASFTVNMGSIPTVNLGLGTVNIGNAHGIFGSVSILGSVNLGGVAVVDTRASLTPTQWIISTPASGQFLMTGSAGANLRTYIHSYTLVANGTVDMQWQSPSGVAISGSMRLLPGAGFALAGNFANGPVLFGSLSSAIYILSAGTQNIGGVALGWIGP